MTLKERVIVETYTGVCMTSGEERNEVYKYMSELIGRPVFTHELASKEMQDELKSKSKADFISLCSESKSEAEIRNKAIDDFFEELKSYEVDGWLKLKMSSIYKIAEQMKGEKE